MAREEELEDEEGESKGIGIDPLEIARFVVECARRHLPVAIAVFLALSVPGVWLSRMIPLKFETQAQILVHPEGIRSRVLENGPLPFRGNELVGIQDKFFRAENIRGIVMDSDIERLHFERRPTLLKWKDKISGDLRKLKPEQRTRALMGTISKRITIEAEQQTGLVTIAATWTDPDTAYRLADVAMKRFLAERLDEEVAVFKEVLAILEEQEKRAARDVEKGLARVEQVGWKKVDPGPKAAAAAPGETSGPKVVVATVKEEGVVDPQTMVRLEKVRQEIRALHDPWQRRLNELKVQLSDLSSQYGPKHPLVINQENRIREAQSPPPGLEDLKAEEAKLVAAIEQMSRPSEKVVRRTLDGSSKDSSPGPAAPQGTVRVDSAELSAEQAKLSMAIMAYNELNERIERTKIEIGTAETSFKYRYQVTQEPEAPIQPLKPMMPLMIAIGSIVVGALFGLLAGALLELMSGKMLAPWQAKILGIPVLAQVRLSEESPAA
ncbi:MAG: hypothetical protein B6A08_06435 [Sorangiineae bacterium NIC37A_2]|nr:MAG: hypothetical protein B6A08_06435 [Sorangiineae bacterium NIC37A_2]